MIQTGTALPIRIILQNYSMSFRAVAIFLWRIKKFPVKEDDLVIINPNVSHTELGSKGRPLEYIALGINGLKFKDGNLDTTYDYSLHNFHEYKEEFSFYLKTLLREIQNKGEYFETVCQIYWRRLY